MFAHRENIAAGLGGADEPDAVGLAVTNRVGGVSVGPHAELNLGGTTDDPVAVAKNRSLLALALGVPVECLVFMRQVHGAEVAVVDRPNDGDPPQVDAMVTRQRGLVLAALVADCTPVMVADPHARVVGAAHAGRRGLAAGVVSALVGAMRRLGAKDLVARVGPSICGRCYEVPFALREDVAASVPEARSVTWSGTPSLDVAAGVMAQLAPHCRELRWLPGCSREDPQLFSYRADPVTGRYAGLVWLR